MKTSLRNVIGKVVDLQIFFKNIFLILIKEKIIPQNAVVYACQEKDERKRLNRIKNKIIPY